MKKIPTLFERVYENHKIVNITDKITPGCEKAFLYGVATIKRDGSCCAIINGEFYKRYDCKKGKIPPEGAISCCDPDDPITGHWPHWVKVDPNNPDCKWFISTYNRTVQDFGEPYMVDGTYEAIGKHFQGNPYKLDHDRLRRHGEETADVARTFEGVRKWLEYNDQEGIVFWLDGEPVCKIKRKDFGFKWPIAK